MTYEDFLFEDFWTNYPKRNGKRLGKVPCRKLFDKLNQEEKPEVVVASKNYAKSQGAIQGYAVDPIRFFKSRDYPDGLWREWLEPEEENVHRARGGGRFGGEEADRLTEESLGILQRGPKASSEFHSSTVSSTFNSERMGRMERGPDKEIIDYPSMEIERT